MNRYNEAKETYAKYGIDTEKALETLKNMCVSVHCWQGDDVIGFDSKEALSGGIQTTGNYLGKARTPEELMADYDKAFSLMPGKKKLNLKRFFWQQMKTAPFGDVWNEYLARENVPTDYLTEIKNYEQDVLVKRV